MVNFRFLTRLERHARECVMYAYGVIGVSIDRLDKLLGTTVYHWTVEIVEKLATIDE